MSNDTTKYNKYINWRRNQYLMFCKEILTDNKERKKLVSVTVNVIYPSQRKKKFLLHNPCFVKVSRDMYSNNEIKLERKTSSKHEVKRCIWKMILKFTYLRPVNKSLLPSSEAGRQYVIFICTVKKNFGNWISRENFKSMPRYTTTGYNTIHSFFGQLIKERQSLTLKKKNEVLYQQIWWIVAWNRRKFRSRVIFYYWACRTILC